jgi:hypothetical protein
MMKSSKDTHSVSYIKRHAKKIRKDKAVPLHEALDLASKEAGFSNWKHLLNEVGEISSRPFQVGSKAIPETISFRSFPAKAKYTRPNTKMPLNSHKVVADLLVEIATISEFRKTVSKPLGYVRNELDEWVQKEYPGAEMSEEFFHQLYFHQRIDLRAKKSITPEEIRFYTEKLEQVKTLLSDHYHDCKPLRVLLSKVDAAIAGLERWIGRETYATQRKSKVLARGTWIHVKALGTDGVVIKHDTGNQTIRFYGNGGPGLCARYEVSVYKDQKKPVRNPMRLYLPYGKWVMEDGSEVLFNREYKPMWKRTKSGEVSACDPNWSIHKNADSWFFDDSNTPWREKKTFEICMDVLRGWGVSNKRPKTLDGYFELVETGSSTDEKLKSQFSLK